MTSEEYDKLSEEEKRIKIATLCGWEEQRKVYQEGTIYQSEKYRWVKPAMPQLDDCGWKDRDIVFNNLPDYLNDLNALHTILMELHPYDRLLIAQYLRYDVFASASQLAKAFVLTMDRE
jgi:hypothetical protein